ncbi:hypothetical protein [Limnobacter sp.]|uniref:hypothetical protein n=1 Tax=Limnobacter sp. TaxID=2003368 RepID=UPI0025B824E2|nr:hypothetical protein [Limnobacter sp.]
MAKIGNDTSYPKKTTPVGADTVIGTDSQDNENTKQFTVQGISDFVTGGSGVVNSVTGPGAVKAQPNTGDVVVDLTNTGVSAGTYTLATVEVDAQGRVLSAASGSLSGGVDTVNTLNGDVTIVSGGAGLTVANTGPSEITITNTASGGGTVTSVTAGTGLDGGTITTTGTIDLANTTVTAGTYTTPSITVNAQGQITSASNINVNLQHVLDNGSLADGVGITLTNGSVIATSAVFNSTNVGNATCLDLTIDEQLLDRNGNFGTDGQILVADTTGAGGVVWSDPGTYVATVTISAAQLNGATPVQVVAAPGASKYIQVLSAAAKYNYGSAVYDFTAPLKLYTNSSVPQFELDENYLDLPASQVRALSLTTSGALDENTALNFVSSASLQVGDGDLELNVQYRIVEF